MAHIDRMQEQNGRQTGVNSACVFRRRRGDGIIEWSRSRWSFHIYLRHNGLSTNPWSGEGIVKARDWNIRPGVVCIQPRALPQSTWVLIAMSLFRHVEASGGRLSFRRLPYTVTAPVELPEASKAKVCREQEPFTSLYVQSHRQYVLQRWRSLPYHDIDVQVRRWNDSAELGNDHDGRPR